MALQRLGMRTTYAGRFGTDAEGRFGLQSLKDEGVDLEFAETIEGARTQVGYIIVEAERGERTVIWNRDERLAYSEHDAPVQLAGMARVIHLDSHDPLACARMAREARAAGTIVSADIDNVYEGLPELLPLIDVLISSKEFPRLLTGIDDSRAALLEIKSRYGCGLVGLTKGGRGATVLCEGTSWKRPLSRCPEAALIQPAQATPFMAGFFMDCCKTKTSRRV